MQVQTICGTVTGISTLIRCYKAVKTMDMVFAKYKHRNSLPSFSNKIRDECRVSDGSRLGYRWNAN